mgnify:CR=1 FL=1
MMKIFPVLAAACVATGLLAGTASADISDGVVRISVMNDQSGQYSDGAGPGSVAAARIAIEEFGGKVAGVPIELVVTDHQNKADIAAVQARSLYDTGKVDVIADLANSAVSLAVQDIARERGKAVLHVGSAHADLYGKACSPTGALWIYDTHSLAEGLTRAVVADGGTSWFFITADYAFGKAIQAEATKILESVGGKVVGSVVHPVNTPDFASFLLQAQGSGAKLVALANAGMDTPNAIKQAKEFGITAGGQKLAVLIFYITSVKAVGAENAQGLQFLTAYYWDHDDASRAFAKRFAELRDGRMPNQNQAGVYSAVRHYLRAVEAAASDDGLTVMRKMKELPVDDFIGRGATIRPDGRLQNDMMLAEVKAPKDIRGEWDLLTIRQTVKGADILRPIAEGGCNHLDPAQ